MSSFTQDLRLLPYKNIYWLGGEIRPGSVRDSVWRAAMLTEILAQEGTILDGKRVLVVGAGISGLTAACYSIGAGAEVHLCERNSEPYSPFQHCIVRQISPTTFDFPQDHYGKGVFPHDSTPSLLEWDEDIASGVFVQIQRQFRELTDPHRSRFHAHYNATVLELDESQVKPGSAKMPHPVMARLSDMQHATGFDVAILATGIGALRRRVPASPDFEGYAYFDNDPLFLHQFRKNAGLRVLLVGGGDGSLADFIRLILGRDDVSVSLESLKLTESEIRELKVIAKEMWGVLDSQPSVLHPVYDSLQFQMIQFIDKLWEAERIRDAVNKLMLLSPPERPAVQICLECCHFGFAYLANRVLAQLIARRLASDLAVENGGMFPFRLGVSVSSIESAQPDIHTCPKGEADSRRLCARFRHAAHFSPKFCVGQQLSNYLKERSLSSDPSYRTFTDSVSNGPEFDRILIRTGADYFGTETGLPKNIVTACHNRGGLWQVPRFYGE